MINAKYVDKDKVKNLMQPEAAALLSTPGCVGPRGMKLGGEACPALEPSEFKSFSFLAKEVADLIDHPGKVWIIMCHDECCVHTYDGQMY